MKIYLSYFNTDGSYYASGEYDTAAPGADSSSPTGHRGPSSGIFEEVAALKAARRLPGLQEGHGELAVMISVPTHPHRQLHLLPAAAAPDLRMTHTAIVQRPERVQLPSSPYSTSWLLYTFRDAGTQRTVWLHELDSDSRATRGSEYRWRCSCGANDAVAGGPLTVQILQEAWSHFESHRGDLTALLHGGVARWYRGGQEPDFGLEVERILGREPELEVPVDPVNVCGVCGESFKCSEDDPHFATGRGPTCPRHENPRQGASSSQDAGRDLYASNGEVVRRVDLDRVAAAARTDTSVAGFDVCMSAKAALAGDRAALDEFHDLAGLALPGVSEYSEGREVRLVMWPTETNDPPRVAFQATSQEGCDITAIDAAELVAWILSPDGRGALARRGVVVPALATNLPLENRSGGPCPKSPSITGSILDEVDGATMAEQLPRALDRLEVVLREFLDAMPEFDGGSPFVGQLGTEMASVRDAAREVCRRAGVPWKSQLEEQRWLDILGLGKGRSAMRDR